MTESTAAQEQQLLPLIDHLARVGRRAADTCGTSCLRPRHLIALKLLGQHGSLTQHALGTALSLDPSNVVGLLNELEDRDLITRRRDPADRRRHIVELSDSGSAELARAYREFGAVEDDLFKTLTAAERATLYTLLSRAVAALAPACETGCAAGVAELSFPGSGKPATGTGVHDAAPRYHRADPARRVFACAAACGGRGRPAAAPDPLQLDHRHRRLSRQLHRLSRDHRASRAVHPEVAAHLVLQPGRRPVLQPQRSRRYRRPPGTRRLTQSQPARQRASCCYLSRLQLRH